MQDNGNTFDRTTVNIDRRAKATLDRLCDYYGLKQYEMVAKCVEEAERTLLDRMKAYRADCEKAAQVVPTNRNTDFPVMPDDKGPTAPSVPDGLSDPVELPF